MDNYGRRCIRFGTLTQRVKGWLLLAVSYLRPWSFICGSIVVFRLMRWRVAIQNRFGFDLHEHLR